MAKDYKGSIDIEIAGKPFTLKGEIGPVIEVGWRDGDVELGKLTDIIGDVAKALVGDAQAQSFDDALNGTGGVLDQLAAVPGLGLIIAGLRGLNISVTDLYIKAVKDATGNSFTVSAAAFGFRGDFDPGTMKLGPVELVGFGVLFEYTKDKAGVVQGRGRTRQIPAA